MFSSPIFGDMFLLKIEKQEVHYFIKVFVSYIRRYVLTGITNDNLEIYEDVFVSYIRRYVLTGIKYEYCK